MADSKYAWLPTPTAAMDALELAYKNMSPRLWPRRLLKAASNAWKDAQVVGLALAGGRKLLEWQTTSYHPQNDTERLYLDDWLDAFGLRSSGSDTTDQNAIVAKMRERGTLTDAVVKSMFARAFGVDDPSSISIVAGDPATIPGDATADDYAKIQSSQHIFNTSETADPNRKLVDSLLRQVRGTGETWTAGRYQTARWDKAGRGWDVATWGA